MELPKAVLDALEKLDASDKGMSVCMFEISFR